MLRQWRTVTWIDKSGRNGSNPKYSHRGATARASLGNHQSTGPSSHWRHAAPLHDSANLKIIPEKSVFTPHQAAPPSFSRRSSYQTVGGVVAVREENIFVQRSIELGVTRWVKLNGICRK
ncbi:hypothetical protein Zmor_017191 [Zophobas morio]|uniref:Uncharacterized protein n=1 Tax=Zophobas morio TaxID=2755281 RepID=A0AA38I7Z7_9CUCU|nr:hypothetical protein Zmor_017191 [Zophobas morio]